MALLDTYCEAYICISQRLVGELGKANEVSRKGYDPTERIHDANGQNVEICGSLTLFWKVLGGRTVHQDNFLVLRPDIFDVIIGKEKIVKGGLLTYNKNALMPMLAHKKVTLG